MNRITPRAILTAVALLLSSYISFAEQPKTDFDMYNEEILFRDYLSDKAKNDLIIYNAAQLDSLIYANMDQHYIPGVALTVIKDSQIVFMNDYGYANLESFEPVTHQTLFLLASISKTFVANVAMLLWQDGLLDLDMDINTYIPFDVTNPYYPEETITMRMLLCHTSSIDRGDGNWWWDTVYGVDFPGDLGTYLENYFDPSGATYAPENYLNQPPGTYYQYSNFAYALAGYLVERIAIDNGLALSLEEYCNEYYFMNLGMDQTSWFLANLDTNYIAMPYGFEDDNYIPLGHPGMSLYPAAQIRTSALQLSNHLIAFMNHGSFFGNSILDSSTVAFMMTDQFPAANPSPGTFAQGIGWAHSINIDYGWSIWGHSGSLPGCKTWMYFDPQERTGFCLLTNSAGNITGGVEIVLALIGFMQDADMDGIVAGLDNCPDIYNPDQADTNSNGIGDLCDLICGDPTADGVVNILDITHLIDYLYQGGDMPDPIASGDANGDGTINILDISYLIAFLYQGGPEPVCP